MPGWSRPTAGVSEAALLPDEARRYVERLERLTGVPVVLISTGKAREETIVYNRARAQEWFGVSSLREAGTAG